MKAHDHSNMNIHRPNLPRWLKIPGGLLLLWILFLLVPPPRFHRPYSTVIKTAAGTLSGAHVAEDGQWHFPAIDPLPKPYIESLLCFEDEYFYYHPGVNPWSLIRAAFQNIKHGEVRSGGSTLTMQVARMATGATRTLPHKLWEMILALRLEVAASKEEILALYAANAPFGGNIIGLETASWRYFERPPRHLTWAESALLAVLPNAPGLMHPGKNTRELKNKRDRLLNKLHTKGKLSQLELEMALAEPLPKGPAPLPNKAPHLLSHFLKSRPGTTTTTTLDASLQSRANAAVQRHSLKLSRNQINHVAALIAEVSTGNILAYIGNSTPHRNEAGHAIDIIQALRSSGSILKPFLYAASLQDAQIMPASILPDVPTHYQNYAPKNFNRQYDGAVPANEALSRSLNIPFVRLLHQYDGERFLKLLQKTGFTSFTHDYSHYGLSLILGGGEVSLIELAGAYASMARVLNHYTAQNSLYFASDIHPLTLTPSDRETGSGRPNAPLFSAGAIWQTFEAMSGLVRPPEESGWKQFSTTQKIAWKTGTSFGYRDAWSIGVDRKYVVAVWAGNASGEGRPGLLGGTSAGPLMFELFNLLPKTTWFDSPYDDMVELKICTKSGYRAGPNCPNTIQKWVPKTVKSSTGCPFHRLIHLTADHQYQTQRECDPSGTIITCPWFVLPPLMEWYYKKNHPTYKPLPPFKAGCFSSTENPMDFIYPAHQKTTLMIPVDLNGKRQRVVVSAVHRDPQMHLFWHLDDRYMGQTRTPHEIEILPSPGIHHLTILDEQGHRLTRTIIIPNP